MTVIAENDRLRAELRKVIIIIIIFMIVAMVGEDRSVMAAIFLVGCLLQRLAKRLVCK